jgi:hypothetical protein
VGAFFTDLFAKIGTWLSDAGNGIARIFVGEINAHDANITNLCVTDSNGKTCITRSRLDSLLAAAGGNPPVPTPTPILTPTPVPAPTPIADIIPPVITLNGPAIMNLNVGDVYTEQGAIVTDNVDTTVPVVINGAVNTATPGTYTITYNATDSSGNHAGEVKRTVNVGTASPSLPSTGNPGLPNTGLPPQPKSDALNVVILSGLILLVVALFSAIYKKKV